MLNVERGLGAQDNLFDCIENYSRNLGRRMRGQGCTFNGHGRRLPLRNRASYYTKRMYERSEHRDDNPT